MNQQEKYARVLADAMMIIDPGACNAQAVLRRLATMIPIVIEQHSSNTANIAKDPALVLVMAQLLLIMRRLDVSMWQGHIDAVSEVERLLEDARLQQARAAEAEAMNRHDAAVAAAEMEDEARQRLTGRVAELTRRMEEAEARRGDRSA